MNPIELRKKERKKERVKFPLVQNCHLKHQEHVTFLEVSSKMFQLPDQSENQDR